MTLYQNVIIEHLKPAGDAISISVIVGTLFEWLPAVAAIISIIWGLIRIFESKTVQRWCRNCIKYIGKDDEPSVKS